MTGQWIRTLGTRSRTRVGPRTVAAFALLAAFVVVAALVASRRASDGRGTAGGDAGRATTAVGAMPASPATDLKAPEEATGRSAGSSNAAAPVAKGGAAAFDGGAGAVPALPSLDSGRTIVRSGGVDVEVRSVADAFEQVRLAATAAGGFVSDSTFTGGGDQQAAHLTLRVPADRFGDVIAQLRGLATTVRSVTTSSRDVTDEYTDVEATLRNLRSVETRYVELLGRASSIGDVLQVQDRLNQTRLQIDRTEARRQLLQSQSELSTIAVTLRPIGGAAATSQYRGPLEAARNAWQASLDTLEGIATAVLVVAVFSWWIVPPMLLSGWMVRRALRRRAVSAAAPVVN